jgi:hypothetical protein
VQVTSLQLGHDQLIMLHFAWVSILLIRVVHKNCVTPPSYCWQRTTWDTNATKYASFTFKKRTSDVSFNTQLIIQECQASASHATSLV